MFLESSSAAFKDYFIFSVTAILQCRIKNSVEAVKEEDMKDRLSSTRMNTYIKGKINTVIRAIKQQEK